MTLWWEGLDAYQQVLFIIAVATTLIMIVQIIMMFVGMGHDASFDGADGADVSGADGADCAHDGIDTANDSSFGMIFGLRVLSVRSVLAFFAIGSWITFTFCGVMYWWAATLIGVAVGAGAAVLVALLMKSIEKLQSSGNIEIKNAIGAIGEVYLTIPAKRSGNGKVTVNVQERLVEFEAVTDCEEKIKTGTKVKVTGAVDENTLLVDRF